MSATPGQVLDPATTPPPALPTPPKESFRERLRLFFRPSNFFVAVPGPIFQKDVWISGRKGGTYWIRGLYAALLLAVIGITFIGNTDNLRYNNSPTARLQQLQTIAPIATLVIIWFEFAGLSLAGAIFGAPTICEEKRAGTLSTLLTTPIKAWQIVLGKTLAFFVQLMILTLIAAPLLLAIRVFGGVSAEHILAGTALSMSTALLAGLCGLYHSISVKRTPSAIMAAIGSTVMLQALFPLLGLLVMWRTRSPVLVEWMFFNVSTPFALGRLTYEAQSGVGNIATMAWITSTLYTLGLCVLIVIASSIRLRKVMAREGEGGSVIPKGKKVKKPKAAPAPIAQPAPAGGLDAAATLTAALRAESAGDSSEPGLIPNIKRKKRSSSVQEGVSRVVGDQPVLWREVRQQAFRSKAVLITASSAIAFGLGMLYYHVGFDDYELHMVLSVLATIVMLITGTVSAASVVSGERESRTWEVLLATPLSAWDILIGKAAGAVRRQWFIPLALMIHMAIAVIVTLGGPIHDRVSPSVFLWLPLIVVPPVFFLSATGTLFSLVCRKSATAAAANLGLALALWAGLPILLGWFIYGQLGRPTWANEIFSVAMIPNPVTMVSSAVKGAIGTHEYGLVEWNDVGIGPFLAAVVTYVGIYLLATYVALSVARSILARQTARAK